MASVLYKSGGYGFVVLIRSVIQNYAMILAPCSTVYGSRVDCILSNMYFVDCRPIVPVILVSSTIEADISSSAAS